MGGWNREWVAGEHGGATFGTAVSHVDVVGAPGGRERVFVGGSRPVECLGEIGARLALLAPDTVVVTSRTYGACAAVRAAALDLGLRLEVWTARLENFPTTAAAYFARDEEMIRTCTSVIEWWDGSSVGTAHELEFARSIGLPVELHRSGPSSK